MRVCPVNFQPCCDDICHGAGCIRSSGEEMIEVCQLCHEFVIDGYCDCELDDDDDFDTGA